MVWVYAGDEPGRETLLPGAIQLQGHALSLVESQTECLG